MNIVRYTTQISRKKLANYRHEPDAAGLKAIEQVCETQEDYYQPAVEVLDAIHRDIHEPKGTTSKQHHEHQKSSGLYKTRQTS